MPPARAGDTARPHAHLHRLRLPVPVDRRRRRALVPQPRRAPRGRRPRGHVPDAAPVGPGDAPHDPGRPGRRGLPRGRRCTGRTATAAIGPPLRFGRGVLRPPAAPRARLRRRAQASFPYFSLLAAARARPRGGYRLVVDWHEVWSREYWREYLGARRRARSATPCSAAARACRSARSASRACTRRGCARRACAAEPTRARGPVRRLARRAPQPRDGRAARRVRRAPHPREARAGAVAGDRPGARARPRRARTDLRRRARARRGARGDRSATACEDVVDAPGFVDARRRGRRAARARCACCSRPRARATGSSSSRPRRTARRRRRRGRGQRGGRAGRAGRQRLRRAVRRARTTWRTRCSRSATRGLALRERTCAWFARERRAAVARTLARRGGGGLRPRAR